MNQDAIAAPIVSRGITVERLLYETSSAAAGECLKPEVDLRYCYDGDPLKTMMLYAMVCFAFKDDDGHVRARAETVLEGMFQTNAGCMPGDMPHTQLAENLGSHALSMMYGKAAAVVEGRLGDSDVCAFSLPAIDARKAWNLAYSDDFEIYFDEIELGRPSETLILD